MRAIGFGRDEERTETNYYSYLNDWVVMGDGDLSSGKVVEVHPDRIALLPYYAINPRDGRSINEVVYTGKPCLVPLNERTRIRPSSEQEALEHCRIMNTQWEKESILKEMDFRSRTREMRRNVSYQETFSGGAGI